MTEKSTPLDQTYAFWYHIIEGKTVKKGIDQSEYIDQLKKIASFKTVNIDFYPLARGILAYFPTH